MSTLRTTNIQHGSAGDVNNIVLNASGDVTIASGLLMSSGTAAAPAGTFTDDVDTGVYSPAADTIAITTSGAERVRVASDGRVILATAANCPGIAWDDNDTTGANVDSRTLGDYEIGTFTPKYTTSNGGDAGIGHLIQAGNYVKIGHMVHVVIQIATNDWDTAAGASGEIRISNFPYVFADINAYAAGTSFNISFRREFNSDVGANLTARFIGDGGDPAAPEIVLYKHATNAATSVQMDASDFMDGTSENYIYGDGWYFTES